MWQISKYFQLFLYEKLHKYLSILDLQFLFVFNSWIIVE